MSRLTELQNWLWINSSIIFQGYKIFTSCQIEVINQMHTTVQETEQKPQFHLQSATFSARRNFYLHFSFNILKLIQVGLFVNCDVGK